MSDVLQAGVLGFIGGYAGAKADQIQLDDDRQYKEALRLRIQQGQIAKERSMHKWKSKFDHDTRIQQRDELLAADGYVDAQGNLVTTGLDPERAAMANHSNIRDLFKEQRDMDLYRTKKDEEIVKIGPDTTVGTGKQIRESLDDGSYRTDGRGMSPSEIRSEMRELRRHHDAVVSRADAILATDAGRWSETIANKLNENTVYDIADDAELTRAFRSMTYSMARSKLLPKYDAEMEADPTSWKPRSPDQVVNEIKAGATAIETAVTTSAAAVEEVMAEWVQAMQAKGKTITPAAMREQANKFIDKGWKRGEEIIHIRNVMSEHGMWNPTIRQIIFETASYKPGRKK